MKGCTFNNRKPVVWANRQEIYLFGPMPRNNLVYIWHFLFFAVMTQFLYGCNVGLVFSCVHEPNSLVGKYFEVEGGDGNFQNMFLAAPGIEELKAIQQTMHDPAAFRNGWTYGQGFANLNQGLNSEQAGAKLIFKVIDFARVPGEGAPFFKIKVCNKKYLGTMWWIRSGNFALATETDSPYAHKFSNHHQATARHSRQGKTKHQPTSNRISN